MVRLLQAYSGGVTSSMLLSTLQQKKVQAGSRCMTQAFGKLGSHTCAEKVAPAALALPATKPLPDSACQHLACQSMHVVMLTLCACMHFRTPWALKRCGCLHAVLAMVASIDKARQEVVVQQSPHI